MMKLIPKRKEKVNRAKFTRGSMGFKRISVMKIMVMMRKRGRRRIIRERKRITNMDAYGFLLSETDYFEAQRKIITDCPK